MKKSQLKLFIKQIVTEAKLNENIQDPTKNEMFEYLRQMYGNEEEFRDTAEVAIYWFASFYHGGQSSHLYSALSTSRFNPGRVTRGPQPNSMEEMMYEELVLKFASGSDEVKKIERKHASLNEVISPKNQSLIEKWMKELGTRKTAYRIIGSIVRQRTMMDIEDMADTATLASGIDEVEQLLVKGQFEQALKAALEAAKEFFDEEAGEGIFEGDEADAMNDMWASSDDDMKSHRLQEPTKPHINKKSNPKQKSGTFFHGERESKPKTVQDFDWAAIQKMLNKGTLKEEKKECQKCKGQGGYSHKFKSGNTQIVPCDNPGCHNGIVDTDEYYRITNGTHGKNCNCPSHDLKESPEQVIYKDRQGGQDVYWMDNKDTGGRINIRPEAVSKMTKRGHRVVDLNQDDSRPPQVKENESDDEAQYVEYVSKRQGEVPFKLKTPNGQEKFEYVNAKYPSGKTDIAVYAFRGDMVYGYNYFRKSYNIQENKKKV